MTQRELEIHAFLHDIAESGSFIEDEVRGMELETYVHDRKTRFAVERAFITIGEALQRLVRLEPTFAAEFADAPRIIGFRNSLTHGYRSLDQEKVWEIINVSLPPLLTKVRALLS